MEAPKVRLTRVLSDTSAKLDRLLPKDRTNLRVAFDQVVAETSDAKGVNDGLALYSKFQSVIDAAPEEGPARDALRALHDRLFDERRYRGDDWCQLSLAQTLREHVKVFGEEKAAEEPKTRKAAGGEK